MKVLVVGGYGVFGGRLVELLADEPRLEVLVAGRSLAKAQAFCRALKGAKRTPTVFDREGDLAAQLAAIAPDVVVDASGPFQAYGREGYGLIDACIAQGASYLDLADASAFVDGVTAFDAGAKDKGVFVLSGVSSFPVLTAAVVRDLSHDMDRVESVEGGIAPSPYAGVGLNVIRAISAYAGQPVALTRAGAITDGAGLVEVRNFTIRPPGHTPLAPVRFSLVDVPDLRVLPKLWPDLREVWMGAGPTPEILHRALNGLALGVKSRLLPVLVPFAPLFHWAINTVRWGEHRGGMYVLVKGLRNGAAAERSWHMVAEGDDGPYIPSMAVEAILRRCLAGQAPKAGARSAAEELELCDYEQLFERRTIYAGHREPIAPDAPLYRRVLGEAYEQLPPAIGAAHDGVRRMVGQAAVERGRGLLARFACTVMGFPAQAQSVPVEVAFEPVSGGELWRRDFAGRKFHSLQTEGEGAWTGLIKERFGAIAVGLAVVLQDERLHLIVRRWSLFGIPMPRSLAPGGEAFEHAADGRFGFDVEMRAPMIGRIVRYRGWLVPADSI